MAKPHAQYLAGFAETCSEPRLKAAIEEVLEDRDSLLRALLLSWEHTDERDQRFLCNCPSYSLLADNSSEDGSGLHSTACNEARKAIDRATGGCW